VSELLEVRVLGAPEVAALAVGRLGELLDLDRQGGPRPSRKTPGLVLYYLAGRLRPAGAAAPCRQAPLVQTEDRKTTRDLAGEVAAITGHWAEVEAQPWWPPQVGDVAIGHPDYGPDPIGATFLAVKWPRLGEIRFREVSSTIPHGYRPAGGYGIEDLWFEWPAISIVRAGTIYPPRKGGGGR
jgi:hypothetical protein